MLVISNPDVMAPLPEPCAPLVAAHLHSGTVWQEGMLMLVAIKTYHHGPLINGLRNVWRDNFSPLPALGLPYFPTPSDSNASSSTDSTASARGLFCCTDPCSTDCSDLSMRRRSANTQLQF